MKNINIKVIKANSEKINKPIVTAPIVENEEKKIVKKITQNVNNWIQEYYENRASLKYPSFTH